MRKSIAHIALAVILAAPALTLITQALCVGQKITTVSQFPFSNDLEDQQDDSDPEKDNEPGLDAEMAIQKIAPLRLPVGLKQKAFSRERLFLEHDQEVGTPPPKR